MRERVLVIDHDVGARPLQLSRHLGLDHVRRFPFAQPTIPDESLETQRTWCVNENDSVEVLAEVPLEEERDVAHDNSVAALYCFGDEPLAHALDFRMDDRVELLELVGIGEDDLPERGTVEATVRSQHRVPPSLDDAPITRRSDFDRPARENIGIDDRRAALRQHLRDGRLAAGDVAGKADEEHGAKVGCGSERVNATFTLSQRPRTTVTKRKAVDRTKGADAPGTEATVGDGERLREFQDLVRRELELLGEDPDRQGIVKTPLRVAKALSWLTRGYRQRVEDVVGDALFDEKHQNMVMVRDIELYSLCEHHLLPFFGRAHVAYIPNGRIVGLSKLPRIVEVYARRLQVQERLTEEIADAIDRVLKPAGVGVVIEAIHLCTRMRGVEKQNSKMITSALRGLFRDDARTRAEFLDLAHGRGGGLE